VSLQGEFPSETDLTWFDFDSGDRSQYVKISDDVHQLLAPWGIHKADSAGPAVPPEPAEVPPTAVEEFVEQHLNEDYFRGVQLSKLDAPEKIAEIVGLIERLDHEDQILSGDPEIVEKWRVALSSADRGSRVSTIWSRVDNKSRFKSDVKQILNDDSAKVEISGSEPYFSYEFTDLRWEASDDKTYELQLPKTPSWQFASTEKYFIVAYYADFDPQAKSGVTNYLKCDLEERKVFLQGELPSETDLTFDDFDSGDRRQSVVMSDDVHGFLETWGISGEILGAS
jgi:hypothetical protein